MNQRRTCLVTGLLCLIMGHSLLAAPDPAPFVSGFDRFGRHEELPKGTAGRLLISELSCAACHPTTQSALQPKGGPRLDGVGNRLQRKWVTEFLSAPHVTKAGTTMPDVLHGLPANEKASTIQALTAFLMSQQKPFPTIKATGANPVPYEFWNKGNVARGRELYHKIGCVACHETDEDYEPGETKFSPNDKLLAQLDPEDIKELGLAAAVRPVNSVPHPDLTAKYTPQALTFFLLNPEQTRPAGRMPQLKLAAVEAADIAAYLLRNQQPGAATAATSSDSAELITAGKKQFVELRCVNCHQVDQLKPTFSARPLNQLQTTAAASCFHNPQRKMPAYPLDELQQTAIKESLAALKQNENPSVANQLAFQLLQFNCYACHERDKQGGVGFNRKPYFETAGHVDLGDEGRIPPTLTGIGFKLQKGWLSKVLKGKGDIRPHMHARMPIFPGKEIAALPNQFEKVDRPQKRSETDVFPQHAQLAPAGRSMLETGCIQCHPIRGESMPGVVGTDLGEVTSRVHAQWFHDFLLDPASLKERTRMPTFFPDGKSQNKDVLKGDVEQQIAAIWAYLKAGDKQPLPEKILAAKSKNYELVPDKKPIILRTFMEEAGTHAIAVGFPQKVHVAFDAEQVRPALAWKGRFLDAQGTWFIRFAPPADPLGDALMQFPSGPPVAFLKQTEEVWPESKPGTDSLQFRGYRIDKQGVPTFLYRYQGIDIEDRLEATARQTLKRRLTIKAVSQPKTVGTLWFRGLTGKNLKTVDPTTRQNEDGLRVSVAEAFAKAGQERTRDKLSEWLIPVPLTEDTTIEVTYQW
ncbi:cytochrome c [Gimesia benthica]|uniref:Cytochrome c n=1 Tax=Gimesia benthica TaxID=2608982 RepID=A0A6I6ADX5_9PLAN|nr:cytochrome oxidase [Gimesia benthica]QGQ23585.1 cytochrome c [Gimesia benthica]